MNVYGFVQYVGLELGNTSVTRSLVRDKTFTTSGCWCRKASTTSNFVLKMVAFPGIHIEVLSNIVGLVAFQAKQISVIFPYYSKTFR